MIKVCGSIATRDLGSIEYRLSHISQVSGAGVGIPAKKVSGRVRVGSMGLILGSGSGPGRVRSTETRQPKAMGVNPGSPFNLNVQKGEENN